MGDRVLSADSSSRLHFVRHEENKNLIIQRLGKCVSLLGTVGEDYLWDTGGQSVGCIHHSSPDSDRRTKDVLAVPSFT